MNKKNILIVGGISSIVLVGCIYGVATSRINEKEQQLNTFLQSIEKQLPPNMKQTNVLNKGLFSSNGVYTLKYTSKELGNHGMTINYTANHAIGSLFGGDTGINATVRVDGKIFKDLNLENKDVNTITGSVKKDGSFHMMSQAPEINTIIKTKDGDDVNIIIGASNSNVNYNKASGKVDMQAIYPAITFTAQNVKSPLGNTVKFEQIKLTRDFDMKYPELGSFSFNVNSVKAQNLSVSGINILADATINAKNNIDTKASLKIDNAEAAGQKGFSLELAYSLNNLDGKFIDLYKKMYEHAYTGKEPTPEDEKAMKEILLSTAVGGYQLNIDKIKIKNATNLFDLTAKYELLPSSKKEEVSFEDKSLLILDLSLQGELAPLAAMSLAEKFNVTVADPKTFKLSLDYKDHTLMVNGTKLENNIPLEIRAALRKIDKQLGFRNLPDLEVPVKQVSEFPGEDTLSSPVISH